MASKKAVILGFKRTNSSKVEWHKSQLKIPFEVFACLSNQVIFEYMQIFVRYPSFLLHVVIVFVNSRNRTRKVQCYLVEISLEEPATDCRLNLQSIHVQTNLGNLTVDLLQLLEGCLQLDEHWEWLIIECLPRNLRTMIVLLSTLASLV